MYILVYVDDVILVRSSSTTADQLILSLSLDLATKDLGKLLLFSWIGGHSH
jgi:hypothetical protein